MDKCPICNTQAESISPTGSTHIAHIRCRICGEYKITRSATSTKAYAKYNDYLVSAALRNHNEKGTVYEIDTKNIDNLFDSIIIPRTPFEKIDRILIYIYNKIESIDDIIDLDFSTDYPIAFTKRVREFSYLMKIIEDMGYLDTPFQSTSYRFTLEGWTYIHDKQKRLSDSNIVFVAMWFNDELKDVWENGFKKALIELKLEPIRIDIVEHNEKICDKIIAEINKSGLLIADFTGGRENVYFEAGYSLGLGIPVIWTCRSDYINKLQFDTRQYNHIEWDSSKDLYKKLITRIEATYLKIKQNVINP